jgi:hypothetical protein
LLRWKSEGGIVPFACDISGLALSGNMTHGWGEGSETRERGRVGGGSLNCLG